jgi:NAD(P)H-hydrate repair Nnr-like enzyme with NAD(P)H-hydrate dehydratase domain
MEENIMSGEVFNAENGNSFVVKISGTGIEVRVDGEITIDKVKKIAKENDIFKFLVLDCDGNELTGGDFPARMNVIVKEYNAAKNEVFTAEDTSYSVKISGTGVSENVVGDVTIDAVKRIAKKNDIFKFLVLDCDGNELTGGDFPYSGNVIVKEYNAAKIMNN